MDFAVEPDAEASPVVAKRGPVPPLSLSRTLSFTSDDGEAPLSPSTASLYGMDPLSSRSYDNMSPFAAVATADLMTSPPPQAGAGQGAGQGAAGYVSGNRPPAFFS